MVEGDNTYGEGIAYLRSLISANQLEQAHSYVHMLWNRILQGNYVPLSLNALDSYHKMVVSKLRSDGIKHVANVDSLDTTQSLSALEKKKDYAIIHPSGEKKGSYIQLKDVLKHFKSFRVKHPSAYLIGGLCNHGKTKGDIDILINLPEEEFDSSIAKVIKFRIYRMLPKGLRDRLHFVYNDGAGPFTNHVPLFSLEAVDIPRNVEEMSGQGLGEGVKEAKMFTFFAQPKPLHGRSKGEVYSVDGLISTLKSLDVWKKQLSDGVFVEKKADGVRVQVHKKGDEVKVFTEENTDVSHAVPTLAAEISKKDGDFIVCGELELWVDGEHQNRADTSGLLNRDEASPLEKHIVLTVYDIVFFNEPIASMPFERRRSFLSNFAQSAHFKIISSELAKGVSGIKEAVKKASGKKGSEGAVLKLANKKYFFGKSTEAVVKFKKERELVVKVVKKDKVKGADAWTYLTVVGDRLPAGKTYNTSVEVEVGDKVRVVFVDISKYVDSGSGRVWFNMWAARVVEKTTAQVASKEEVEKAAKETTGVAEKRDFPSRYKNLQELQNKSLKFVYQHHWRGESVHGDLRFVNSGEKSLHGFTLFVQRKGLPDKPVDSLEKAKKIGRQDIFKLDYSGGKVSSNLKQDKIEAVAKGTQPLVWLEREGVTAQVDPGEQVPAGATAEFPGVFHIIDKGFYQKGAQKPYFKEYFLNGKVFKGRYVFRKTPKSEDWDGAGGKPFVWFFWKPDDQIPYILSKRALQKIEDIPLGKSASSWLPKEWEDKIPTKLRWWGKDITKVEAADLLNQAQDFLKQENELSELSSTSFVLQRVFWKGQKVIRNLPVEYWVVRFEDQGLPAFHFDKSPLIDDTLSAKKMALPDKRLFSFSGEVKPGGEAPGYLQHLNPNKELSAFVEVLDKGKVDVVVRSANFISVRFKGADLSGYWNFQRKNGLWVFEKGRLPKVRKENSQDHPLKIIYEMTISGNFSRTVIAETLSMAKSTVYRKQKELGF